MTVNSRGQSTHIDFTQHDIHDTSNDDDEVEDVPGVSEITLRRSNKQRTARSVSKVTIFMQIFESAHLHFKRHDFEYHLHSEEHGEDHIQHVRQMGHVV